MLFYDFEVFKNDWLVVIMDMTNKKEHIIINNKDELESVYNEHKNDIWIGYNNKGYDQYIFKGILCGFNPKEINDFIILQGNPGYKFSNILYKIPMINYDVCIAGDGGLKSLEGFRGANIHESSIPFDLDRKLTDEEIEETIKYCKNDVIETIEVFLTRKEEFDSQFSLIKTFNLPLSNLSKTKAQLTADILGAVRIHGRKDEFDISIPTTLRIEKYKEVVNWYKNPLNRDYNKELNIDIAGVPHTFAWGGIHGAREKYIESGYFINVDVASYYPALMIEYDYLSRNVSDKNKYREIRDTRLKLKAEKNPMQQPYKIVLNGCYGAMKDPNNNLYDPLQANNVCVTGQLLLLDLIEKLEPFAEIIQSNTDGILIKMPKNQDKDKWFNLIDDICYEWESRTRMQLEFDEFVRVCQKDVNNYVIVSSDGKYKSKGAYVKKLSSLDYDLPIVNKAVTEYLIKGTSVQKTINECNELKEFQKIVKVSSKYKYGLYNPKIETQKVRDEKGKLKTIKVFIGGIKQNEKCFRVFSSIDNVNHGGIFKVKNENKNPEKFANTPEVCFIDNSSMENKSIPGHLDKSWYIELAKKRLEDFGVKQ